MNKKTSLLLTLVFVFGSIFLFNSLVNDVYFSLDLTKNNQFTISDYSKDFLSRLDDPVIIDFYIANNLPAHAISKKNDAVLLLKELARYSKGFLRLNIMYKDISTDMFKDLNALGITKIQMNVFDNDYVQVLDTFSGLVMFYEDKRENIPVVLDSTSLEYKLILKLKKLTQKKQPIISIVHNDLKVLDSNFSLFKSYLEDQFDVRFATYSSFDDITSDLSLFVNPINLSTDQVSSISRYVESGHNAFFLVDLFSTTQFPYVAIESGLSDFFNTYGIFFNHHLILDSFAAKTSFVSTTEGYDYKSQFKIDNPYFPVVKNNFFLKSNPALTLYGSVVYPFGSSLALQPFNRPNFKRDILMSSNSTSVKLFPPFQSDPTKIVLNHPTSSYPLLTHISGFIEDKDVSILKSYISFLVMGSSSVISNATLSEFPENALVFYSLVDWLLLENPSKTLPLYNSDVHSLKSISSTEKMVLKWGSLLFFPLCLILTLLGILYYKKRARDDFKK